MSKTDGATAAAVTTASFDADVLQSDLPVLVDFWAPWCPPCRRIAPDVEALAEQMQGRARVYKLNTDEEPDLTIRYGVQSIPTLLIFKNGEVVDQIVGAAPRRVMAERLQAHIVDGGSVTADGQP